MYGPIIKQIRQDKDLPLKAVYTNVCSKTNAIKFENGDRVLAADKFTQVLKNLFISMAEFLWIANGYKPKNEAYQHYLIRQSWNADKKRIFETQVANLELSDVKIQRIQLASYCLLKNHEQNIPLDQSELELVVNYFNNLSSWTLSDVKFFANNGYVLPYPLMVTLLGEVLKVQQRYRFFENSEAIFAAVLVNCVDRMISAGDFDKAKATLKILQELTVGIPMAGYRLLSKYYRAKIEFLNGDTEMGRNSLIEIRKASEFLGIKQIVDEITSLLL
ncbi:hypothetical protein ACNAN0_00575 [Agrilactobacillus fermenti]|uniref:Rgg family transcriptional regulator n=1 Tax=Agrilactobacillus fermenti TaxID=2586909 RepID=UPI003A5BBDB5